MTIAITSLAMIKEYMNGLDPPPNWCWIFFADPKAEFDSARLVKVLQGAGLNVTGQAEPYMVRCGNGPTMHVSILRSNSVETVIRSLVGSRRQFHAFIAGCDTQIKIELDNVEEVLDEINTLIEVQTALQTATRGLMYCSWNREIAAPES